MINCRHCHRDNRPQAFYCRYCGYPLACPRCRVLLEEPAQFCDNCGQFLSYEGLSSEDELQSRVSRPETQPAPPRIRQAEEAPSASSAPQAELARFIPPELRSKLEAARNSDLAGERRVVTMLFADIQGSTSAAEQPSTRSPLAVAQTCSGP